MTKNLNKWGNYDTAPPVNKDYLYHPIIVKIRADIPFYPDKRQVIYIESQYNKPLNDYISKEYATIVEKLKYRGFSFEYLPHLVAKLTEAGNDMVKYTHPALNDDDILFREGALARNIAEKLRSYSSEPAVLTGGLMRYFETEGNFHIFRCYQFEKF
jgi:hypothetical protein